LLNPHSTTIDYRECLFAASIARLRAFLTHGYRLRSQQSPPAVSPQSLQCAMYVSARFTSEVHGQTMYTCSAPAAFRKVELRVRAHLHRESLVSRVLSRAVAGASAAVFSCAPVPGRAARRQTLRPQR